MLAAYRDPDLTVHLDRKMPKLIHNDHDAPPWWNMKYKTHLYSDGFAGKGPRALMQFMMTPSNGPEKFHESEDEFVDIYDWIEKLDDWITAELERRGVAAAASAPQNTETLGSTIDRLSILALRIYHLAEQRDRADGSAEHRQSVERKLAVALAQHDDLSRAAQQLADDLFAGRKRHKTYRQLKMYNDATLNPYLYQARRQTV